MPQPAITFEQASQLLTSIDSLTGQVAELHVEVASARAAREADDRTRAEENASRDRRSTWIRRFALLALLAAVLSTAVAIDARGKADDAKVDAAAAEAKADAILQARDTARKITCDAFNDQQLLSRAGDDRQTRLHFEALASFTAGDDGRTPDEEAEVRAFLDQLYADQAKAGEKSYPLRDCTPEGIARFYEEHQP